jgi:hypothetical protein
MKPESRRFRRPGLAALLLTALAACTSAPTPHQVEGESGGYSEQQIEADRYSIKFVGNSATSRETVEEYALYRAAEVTLENGHDYFKVVSKEIEPIVQSRGGVFPSVGIGLGGGNVGVGVSTGFGGGRADYSYAAYLDIVMYDGEKPAADRDAYTALDVIENLKGKVLANTPAPDA